MNKASRGDGISGELLQILKDDAVNVLHSVCQQIFKNSAVATGLEKVSFHSTSKERQCKGNSNYNIIALITHASKVILKFLQARFQQYTNCELPDVQAWFRKGRGSRYQIASTHWIKRKSKRVPEKHLLLLY